MGILRRQGNKGKTMKNLTIAAFAALFAMPASAAFIDQSSVFVDGSHMPAVTVQGVKFQTPYRIVEADVLEAWVLENVGVEAKARRGIGGAIIVNGVPEGDGE